MRCGYCYNGRKFQRPMPAEVALRGVDLMFQGEPAAGSRTRLEFFGGEPLLELDLIRRTVDHAEKRARDLGTSMEYRVATNATLLQGEALDFLLERRFFLAVSLDGCQQAHDLHRRFRNGRPSHRAVVRNIAAARRRDPRVRMRAICVIDPQTVRWLAPSFQALLELGLNDIAFNLNYQARWDRASRRRFQRALGRLGEAYVECFRADRGLAVNILDSKIEAHLAGGFSPGFGCDFGCRQVTVAPSGRLYPCERLVQQDEDEALTIGHLVRGIDDGRRAAMVARKDRLLPDCADCAVEGRCVHWCGCANHAMTGDVGEVTGTLCWFEQQLIEQADRCAEALYQEQNPLFLERFYGGV